MQHHATRTKSISGKAPILDCVEAFRFVWLQQLKLCREHIATANLMGGTFTYGPSSSQYSPQSVSLPSPAATSTTSNKRSHSAIAETSTLECVGCGRNGHSKDSCHFKSSPYFKKGGGKYSRSSAFSQLKKDRPTHTELIVPRGSLKKPLIPAATTSSSSSAAQNKEGFQKRKGELNASVISNDSEVLPIDSIPDYSYFYLSLLSDKAQQEHPPRNKIQTLLDTGSLAGNFILRQLLVDLSLDSHIVTDSCPITVCSGLDNACYPLTFSIHLRL